MRYFTVKYPILLVLLVIATGCVQTQQSTYEVNGLSLTWLGHASFVAEKDNITIYFDPYVLGNETKTANYILITHDHTDHCDPEKVRRIQSQETRIISVMECIKKLSGKTNSIIPGEFYYYSFDNINFTAYDAYNLNKTYHAKGSGVGFLVDFNGTKIYDAGDTDNIPELAELAKENIDILLVPIGGTYTMNVSEAAEATKIIKPKVAIPMHYGSDKYGITGINADPQEFKRLLEGSGIEVVVLNPLVR